MKYLLSLKNNMVFAALVSVYSGMLYWLETHLISCPIKSTTGIDCPGCGMQRAFICLLKGDIKQSFIAHPSVIPMLVMFLFLIVHLRLKFRKGGYVIVGLFSLSTVLMIINYIRKILDGNLI